MEVEWLKKSRRVRLRRNADGSNRLIDYTIDVQTHRHLGSRKGASPVDGSKL